MGDRWRRAWLYFHPTAQYWQLTEADERLAVDAKPLARYPLDIAKRITTGHYDRFDEQGLPVRRSRFRPALIHNYSTLCAFGLGHWNLYLETGEAVHLARVVDVGDYILKTAEITSAGAVLLRSEGEEEHSGFPSAIYQGEAMSLFCRAWQSTGNRRYLDAAVGCLAAFEMPTTAGGILGRIPALDVPWYEEYPTLLKHVLNGMIYSLFGLRDVAICTSNERAKELFDRGVESVVRALPLFDAGYWSFYSISETRGNYTASMMYHNLHICQLKALAGMTGRTELTTFASTFSGYAESIVSRMGAAMSTARAKVLQS